MPLLRDIEHGTAPVAKRQSFSCHQQGVQVRFRAAGGDQSLGFLGVADEVLEPIKDDQLDLGRVLETETTLALPMRALCREDCRGLCPVCGGNRNAEACACRSEATDPRWAALRGLVVRATN